MDHWQRLAWIVWIGIVVAGTGRAALVEHPRHRGCYDVFADGGRHWLHGEGLYNLANLNSLEVFRYSPPVGAACVPLALVPDMAGSALLRLVSFAVLLMGLHAWSTTFSSHGSKGTWWLLTALAGASSLMDVQLTLIMLGCMLIGTAAVAQERWNVAAAALALAVCLKAYPIALALLLACVYPRQLAPRLLIALLLLAALPFAMQAPSYVVQQYDDWLRGGLNQRYFDGCFQDVMFLWQRWVGPMERTEFTQLSVLAGLVVAGVTWLRRHAMRACGAEAVFGLACAWMMAFGPATEATTYVVLAPAAALAAVRAFSSGMPLWPRAAAVAAVTLLILAQLQLLFPLDRPLHQIGAQPIAALLLLAVFKRWQPVAATPEAVIFHASVVVDTAPAGEQASRSETAHVTS